MLTGKAVDQLVRRVKSLAADADCGGALQRICELLRHEVPWYDWVGYYLAVPAERLLVLGPFAGAPTEHLRIPYGRGICGQAAASGLTFVVPDVAAESNYLSCSVHTRAEIVVPLFHRRALVGELDIDSHTADPFTSTDTRLLGRIARITAPLAAALVPPPDQPVNASSSTR